MRRLLDFRSKKSNAKARLRQAPAEFSASPASAKAAAAVAHGLQVVAESANPTVEYASYCLVARLRLTRLQYCRGSWPERTSREDVDNEQRRQLAARPPPARPPKRAHPQLGLRREHTQQLARELSVPL
jgi:hypothetical protein